MLIIVATVSALVYHITTRQNVLIAATAFELEASDVRMLAASGEALALAALRTNRLNTTFDHYDEAWSDVQGSFENGQVFVRVQDLNARLNLNALAGVGRERVLPATKWLVAEAGIPPEMAEVVSDWIDTDDVPLPYGREELGWLSQNPPFRPANTFLADLSELVVVSDATSGQVAELSRYVTCLPDSEVWLNVNTVEPKVLEALVSDANKSNVRRFTQLNRRFETVMEAVNQEASLTEVMNFLRVQSSYFEIQVLAVTDQRNMSLTSHAHVSTDGEITVFYRDFTKQHARILDLDLLDG